MSFQVVGLGNALVDALVVLDETAMLSSFHLERGTAHMVDHATWERAYSQVSHLNVRFESGGSCANTIATLGLLGVQAVFCGQVGHDPLGQLYGAKLDEACGTHALRVSQVHPTGKCLSMISNRDAERTMVTDLGAGAALTQLGDFEPLVGSGAWVHYEGYMLLDQASRAVVLQAMQATRAGGGRVSLDVSDPHVVQSIRPVLHDLLADRVDVVFINAEEARGLVDLPPKQAVVALAERYPIGTVVLKMGAQGSLIYQSGTRHNVGVRKVKAVDTTGAGDAYAGGFLYGLVAGWSPERCGQLASAVAALTVSQVGAVAKNRQALADILHEVAPPPVGRQTTPH